MELLKRVKTPGILIFDMDDVLVPLAPTVYRTIQENFIEFMPYLKDLGMLTDAEIYARNKFQITEWLKEEELEDKPEIKQHLFELVDYYCFSENCYDNVKPTKIADRTLRNSFFMSNNIISKCYIVSRSATKKMTIAKMNWLKKYFAHPKLDIVILEGCHKSKFDAINELNIDWCLMIDDELKNIIDVAEKSKDLNGREFLLPKFGYNQCSPEHKFLIEQKGGTISYYTNL